MALTDYVIMPGADYQAACDAIREKTGKSDTIVSGDLAEMIAAIEAGEENLICGLKYRHGQFTPAEDITTDYTVEFEKLGTSTPSMYMVIVWVDFQTVNADAAVTLNAGQLSGYYSYYKHWRNGNSFAANYTFGMNTGGAGTQTTSQGGSRSDGSFKVPFSPERVGKAGFLYNWLVVSGLR